MNSHRLYLDTKPSRLFFKAAIPGGISMLASSMYQIFDAIFVGKYLGTTAFAALGLVYPLIIVNFALSDLVGVGASVPISIALGRKEEDKANNYFTCACLLILFIVDVNIKLIIWNFDTVFVECFFYILDCIKVYIPIIRCFTPDSYCICKCAFIMC